MRPLPEIQKAIKYVPLIRKFFLPISTNENWNLPRNKPMIKEIIMRSVSP
jgi:hypothetical protein